MGKSHKRLNKDKINALRKEYDNFLEDDKKRKHRNEFILDRLEIMRSSVSSMHRKDYLLNNKLIMKHTKYYSDLSFIHPEKGGCRNDLIYHKENEFEENNILKEISKKYILIPKINSVVPRLPIVGVENDDDSDWRSKYNILEQLKRNEISEPPEKDIITPSKLQENPQHSGLNNKNIQSIPDKDSNCITKFHDEYTHKQNEFSKNGHKGLVNLNANKHGSDDIKPIQNSTTNKELGNIVQDDERCEIPLKKGDTFSSSAVICENIQDELHENNNEPIKQIDLQTNYDSNILKNEPKENTSDEVKYETVDNSNILAYKRQNIVKSDNPNLSSSNYNANTLQNKGEDLENDNTKENNVYEQSIIIQNETLQNQHNEINEPKSIQEQLYLYNDIVNIENDSNVYEQVPSTEVQYHKNQEIQNINPIEELDDNKKGDNAEEPETIIATTVDEYNTHINEFEMEQKEMFYTDEHNTQFVDNRATENEHYDNEEHPNVQYNYYDGQNLQENQSYENVEGIHEATPGYGQQYGQTYDNSYGNEYANEYESQPQQNYDPHNENQTENLNYEYQQTQVSHVEYDNTENAPENIPAMNIDSSNYQQNNQINEHETGVNVQINNEVSENDVQQQEGERYIPTDTINIEQGINNDFEKNKDIVESKPEDDNVDDHPEQNQISQSGTN